MNAALNVVIAKPYQSTIEIKAAFQTLEQLFRANNDRRAVFVTAYLEVTSTIMVWIAEKRFQDNAWVDRYLLAFANLYRSALLAYETDPKSAPGVWSISFTESQAGRVLVTQDLLLGIHAHVNRDLAYALVAVGVGPDMESRHADHNLVNDILDSVTNDMQNRISRFYARGLGVLDHLLGPLDENFSSFSVRAARENAWQMGLALTNAGSSLLRPSLEAGIDRQAKILARLILTPNVRLPWIIDAMKTTEHVLGWVAAIQK